ncbi:SRPBCC domain-containing protein [Streptomyces sp. NBC_01264]|uniref:SRPBCC domain-containing protein n=1 Tax=Streptomyces sp. NBC_01264 TaxID=2903804 RepID=UPI0022591C76|nr:SRPBCC domain-containing protein [Streptomyces sp. NBC_01264]MCX4775658.1 SRPBCC domain-containing protein [Streptomyces sp. NBC_01264]
MTPSARADSARADSARKQQLLELAYAHVLDHGLADMSLRPLAEAIGSSPRVLLFLFGSKDALVQALLARARQDETGMLEAVHRARPEQGLARTGELVWSWLADPGHRKVLTLWVEGYSRSLSGGDGPWAGFAERTIADWLELFAAAQPPARRDTPEGLTERSLLLSVLRGALLDLLASGDEPRTTAAVTAHLRTLETAAGSAPARPDRTGNGSPGRTDRGARTVAAPPGAVYAALLDRESLESWLPPDGMSGRIEHWDPRPGGGFRMVLTYLDPAGSPGKTSGATDVADVRFTGLVPAERVVQQAVFESEDPSYAGTMTMTWQLAASGEGTEVTVTATDVPPGIDQADHEAGIASSLAHLASYVEATRRPGPPGTTRTT